MRGNINARRKNSDLLNVRRERPYEIDARHRQQFADLLKTDIRLAARYYGGHRLAFDLLHPAFQLVGDTEPLEELQDIDAAWSRSKSQRLLLQAARA